MISPRILPLEGSLPEGFGGKAAGLARLIRAGMSVPPGFALSPTTHPPQSWDPEVRQAFERACTKLLQGGSLAVRSSAEGEDGAARSFAGLFESILGVASVTEALEAATRCIASGSAARVLTYAGREAPIPVGVVVMRLVEAAPRVPSGGFAGAAGVVFSRDPLGRDPAVVVEAVAGLGEALVSGHTAPERWRIYQTGMGEREVHRSLPGSPAGSGRLSRVSPDLSRSVGGVLSGAQACELATAATALAVRWGEDLDLEWAYDREGTLWWLQARPITTGSRWIPPVVDRSSVGEDDGPVSVWTNMNARESMPDPLHPLAWSVWKRSLVPAVMQAMTGIPEDSPTFARASGVDLVNGRIYFNLNAFLVAPLLGPIIHRAVDRLDVRVGRAMRDLMSRGVLKPRKNPGATVAMLKGLVLAPFRKKARLPSKLDPAAWLETLARAAETIRRRAAVETLSDQALVAELDALALPEATSLRAGLEVANVSFYFWVLAESLFRRWPEARRLLGTGVVGNPTTEISLEVEMLVRLGRPIQERFAADLSSKDLLAALRREDASEVVAWLAALEGFLDKYGHRAPREFDLATPRWADDPGMVLELVRSGLRAPEGKSLTVRLEGLARQREAAIEAAIRQAPAWRRPLMRWAARKVTQWMPLREAPKHHAMQALMRSRLAALELGRRLTARGLLPEVEAVHFVRYEELSGLLAGKTLPPETLATRQADLARWMAQPAADIVRSDGVPVLEEAEAQEEAGVLRGMGIGGGIGEGPVNVLLEPDPSLVRPGDVLVVAYADPCWTPLFPQAAAVVMEVGGVMCHAAVVARELGKPAVFGVRSACTRLRPGERIRVEGDTGRVVRLEGDHEG